MNAKPSRPNPASATYRGEQARDPWLERWFDLLGAPGPGRPLLDCGCGPGSDAGMLAKRGYPVIATDTQLDALRRCAQQAPGAMCLYHDLRTPLPFADDSLRSVVASLCLHYFPWETTVAIVREMGRVLPDNAVLLCRVNSTKDVNFGASGYPEIGHNYFQVGDQTKRFFDVHDIDALFDTGWRLESIEEKTIDRYRQEKVVWELALVKRPRVQPLWKPPRRRLLLPSSVHAGKSG